jgi:hypothetical protein
VVGLLDEEDDETSPGGFLEGATRQLEWAIHMGIPAVILPPPAPGAEMEYAGVVQTLALEAQANNLQIWIRTHLAEKSLAEYELVQTLCDGLTNIGIMLVMDPIPNGPRPQGDRSELEGGPLPLQGVPDEQKELSSISKESPGHPY